MKEVKVRSRGQGFGSLSILPTSTLRLPAQRCSLLGGGGYAQCPLDYGEQLVPDQKDRQHLMRRACSSIQFQASSLLAYEERGRRIRPFTTAKIESDQTTEGYPRPRLRGQQEHLPSLLERRQIQVTARILNSSYWLSLYLSSSQNPQHLPPYPPTLRALDISEDSLAPSPVYITAYENSIRPARGRLIADVQIGLKNAKP